MTRGELQLKAARIVAIRASLSRVESRVCAAREAGRNAEYVDIVQLGQLKGELTAAESAAKKLRDMEARK